MRIFLSAVSAQFEATRDILASDLRARGAEVCWQKDFTQQGGTLLEKLEDLVAGCDRVIALIGDAYGAEPETPARPRGFPRRSYTQWEFCFARGERLDGSRRPPIPTYVYFASAEFLNTHQVVQAAEVAGLQREFAQEARVSGQDWNEFGSTDALRALVLRDATISGATPGEQTLADPELLPYLCDREDQERELLTFLGPASAPPTAQSPGLSGPETGAGSGRKRPKLCVIYGERHEAHRPFVDRVRDYTLRRHRDWQGRGRKFLDVRWSPRAATVAAFGREVRESLRSQLCLNGSCDNDAALALELNRTKLGLVALVVVFTSEESSPGLSAALEVIREYWQAFPDLVKGPAIACLVLVLLAKPAPRRARKELARGRKLTAAIELPGCDEISAWAASVGGEPAVACCLLPELSSARRADGDRWASLNDVRSVLPTLNAYDIDEVFQEEGKITPAMPMDAMHARLHLLIEKKQRRRSAP